MDPAAGVTNPVQSKRIGTAFNTALPLAAFSAATWFTLTTERRKEWIDILLDYVHHKRTQYSPTVFDPLVRVVRSALVRIR